MADGYKQAIKKMADGYKQAKKSYFLHSKNQTNEHGLKPSLGGSWATPNFSPCGPTCGRQTDRWQRGLNDLCYYDCCLVYADNK